MLLHDKEDHVQVKVHHLKARQSISMLDDQRMICETLDLLFSLIYYSAVLCSNVIIGAHQYSLSHRGMSLSMLNSSRTNHSPFASRWWCTCDFPRWSSGSCDFTRESCDLFGDCVTLSPLSVCLVALLMCLGEGVGEVSPDESALMLESVGEGLRVSSWPLVTKAARICISFCLWSTTFHCLSTAW